MNITKKYNIKMSYNVYGASVPEDYVDQSEIQCILKFEEICLKLKELKNEHYTMIELGSNYAYYSMLFRAIIDGENKNKKCKNVMLEPTVEHLESGKQHFRSNGFEGIFERGGIGHYWCAGTRWHDKAIPSYTIDELMKKYDINHLDVLHSDIDGNEIRLLETSNLAFKEKKIRYVFMLTHGIWQESKTEYNSKIIKNGENRHEICKQFFLSCGYNLLLDVPANIGYDGLLVFET